MRSFRGRVVLTTLALCSAVAAGAAQQPALDYAACYAKGITFAKFLENAQARREEWRERYSNAAVTPDLVTRMRALPERRRILVVAEDWCADSAQSVPYVARLVDGAPERLEMRVIDSKAGLAIMEAHPTPDGRATTPTIVILTEDGRLVGAWSERPSTLHAEVVERSGTEMQSAVHDFIMKWYKDDRGKTTMAEIATLLEKPAPRDNN